MFLPPANSLSPSSSGSAETLCGCVCACCRRTGDVGKFTGGAWARLQRSLKHLRMLKCHFVPSYKKTLCAQFPLPSDSWISLELRSLLWCFSLVTSPVCRSYDCVGREPVPKHECRLCLMLQDLLVLYSPCSSYTKVVSFPWEWTLTNGQLFKKRGSSLFLNDPWIQMDLREVMWWNVENSFVEQPDDSALSDMCLRWRSDMAVFTKINIFRLLAAWNCLISGQPVFKIQKKKLKKYVGPRMLHEKKVSKRTGRKMTDLHMIVPVMVKIRVSI